MTPAADGMWLPSAALPDADPSRLSPRALLAARAGRFAAWLSLRTGRGSGTTIGGRVARALDPRLLARLSRGRQVVLVSGTNGKSTTARFLAEALSTQGPVALNTGGANMEEGLTLAAARQRDGHRSVFEVDESYLGRVAAETGAAVVVLLNLSRDQLDRVGEVHRIAARWREELTGLAPGAVVVANADDPLVVWAAEVAPRVVWVGAGTGWNQDATLCPRCHALLAPSPQGWHCTGCQARRPDPDLWLDGEVARSRSGASWPLDGRLPGRVNRVNTLFAVTAAAVCGLEPAVAAEAVAQVTSVYGRYERTRIGRHDVRLLLAKNPAGWAELLDMLDPDGSIVVAINAQVADGCDTSWLWDVDFERLRGRQVAVTGRRRADVAVRLTVAGVTAVASGDFEAVLGALPPGRVDVAANYTAMQHVHRILDSHRPQPPAAAEATRVA